MSKGLVTLIGGSGFLGRYAARILIEQGWRVRVACRRVHVAIDVRLAGAPGWVDVVQANIRDRASLERAVEGADAVVNLVGILHEHGRQTFKGEHVDGAALLADVVASKGIKRFVHVSAIGADEGSRSSYERSKAQGEAAVRKAVPGAVILRPSIVFGPEDKFFNRLAGFVRMAPLIPSLGGGKSQLQPVYAGDVAEAIAAAVALPEAEGRTYELGGPRLYALKDIFEITMKTIDRKRFQIPAPFFAVRPFAYITGALWRFLPPFCWGFFGAPPITGSQMEMLTRDNVVGDGVGTLADLGVHQLESVEAIVPGYLWRFRPYGEFHEPATSA